MTKSFYIVRVLATGRKLYEQIYLAQEEAPLYSAPWWLDATCGYDGWEVLSNSNPPSILIPYYRTSIRGMKAAVNPALTQWLPVLKNKMDEPLQLTSLLESISQASILDISLKPIAGISLNDVQLPVHVKYTYLIPAGISIKAARSKYNEGLRRNLKEAQHTYSVTKGGDVEKLLMVCRATFQQRHIKLPPWFENVIPRVFDALQKNQCGYLSFIQHRGNIIAGVLIGFDKNAAYYLAGGRTGDEGGASAHALLLDQAISEAIHKGLSFDFEGSMQPGVANFFQSFGAIPSPYWHIRKLKGIAKIWGVLHP